MFYNEFPSPIHKNHTPKKNEKTNKLQTPLHITENRPSSKTFVFVTYFPPKSNDWTPPRDLPRSPQKVPKPTQGTPETPPELSEGPPGPPGRPGSHETPQKSTNTQTKFAGPLAQGVLDLEPGAITIFVYDPLTPTVDLWPPTDSHQ